MLKCVSKKNLWENLPQPLKKRLGILIGIIPLPILLGKNYRKWDRIVETSDRWEKEKVENFQIQQLRSICNLAYEKSKYYRASFDRMGFHPADLKQLYDLEKLPIIDKHVINNNSDAILTVKPSTPGLDYVSTGGSSGNPLRFLIGSDRSAIEYAHLARSWMRIGYKHKIPKAVLRGQIVASDPLKMPYAYDPLLRNHLYSSFHLNDETMLLYLKHISTIGPCFLHTYPSSLNILVRYITRSKLTPPDNIKGLLLESENVYSEDRKAAEKLFGVRYFSSYGHSEKLVMASECEHSSNYHVFPTYGYCELIDDKGNPVNTPGQEGEIVGTGYINRAMPFIRYRTGDYATYVGDYCNSCGRNQLIIKDIRGHRTMETLVAKDGALIPYTAVNTHDDTFEEVLQYQFVQSVKGQAILKIVPSKKDHNINESKIQKQIESRLQGQLSITIDFVDKIALTSRGKSVYVDQKIDISSLI